jgi:hypothetical protein
MKPYQPSLAAPAGGLVLLFLAAILGGAAIGAVVSLFAHQVIYLVLVFPVVMGFLMGYLIARAVHAGKIRNPRVAIGFAVLAGLVVYASLWVVDFLQYQNSIAQMDFLGRYDFLGFVMERAQGNENHYILNLGPILIWIYWAVELALIVGLSILVGRRPAYDPFCEPCNRWFGAPRLMGTLGTSRSKELLELVNGGLFLKLGEELQSNPALPNLGVYMATPGADCEDGGAFLAVRKQTRSSGTTPNFTVLESGLITSPQMQDLLRGIENRKALYGG